MDSIGRRTDGLRWSQSSALKLKEESELRAGADLGGTLKLRSMLGTLATAESADGCWTFKRVGFFQNRATIRARGSERDVAVFKNNTWTAGGTLEFPDGPTFRATTNFWLTSLEFRTDTDEPLVRLKYGGFFRRSADVEISSQARAVVQLPLLVLFGWYLLVMLDRDAGAVAVV